MGLDAVEHHSPGLETTSWVIDSSWMSLIPCASGSW